jgi:hypothetical protein
MLGKPLKSLLFVILALILLMVPLGKVISMLEPLPTLLLLVLFIMLRKDKLLL